MVGAGSNDGAAYVAERLDHLGIVAGICREIGLAAWLDAQDEGSHERVRVGTSTVAMILNGLGFSNRRLYLVPQLFATKPVERLLGPGITAADLSDDCLGRALDWLYAHDPTSLFACEVAGVALCSSQGVCSRRNEISSSKEKRNGLSEQVGPFADGPFADHAVQDERIAPGVFFGGFTCDANRHAAQLLLRGGEEGAGQEECALGMQLVRACLVGGNDIGCFREGIFEGVIEGLEEYDIIYPLLRYDHRFMTSSSGVLCPYKQFASYQFGGTCIKGRRFQDIFEIVRQFPSIAQLHNRIAHLVGEGFACCCGVGIERKAIRMAADEDERQAFLAQLLEIITDHPGIEVVSIEPVPEASQDERLNAREISSGEDVTVA